MVAGRGQLIIDLVNKQYIRATNVKLCFWSLGPLGRNTDAAIFGKKKKITQHASMENIYQSTL